MSVASSASLPGCTFQAARALVAVALFLVPLDADALSCDSAGVTAPFRRTKDVPTNTRIWCPEEPQWPIESIVLRDAQGSVVSGTQATLSLPDVTVLVFRPDVDLAPQSTYTYECPFRDVSEFTFSTGAGPRIGAPPVPDSSRWTAHAAHQEGAGDNYLVSFDSGAEPDSIVVFDIGGTASMDADGPSGVLSDLTEALYRVHTSVGNGICERNWPEAALGASTTVALGAFDVTGAFSGWSDTVTVTLPSTFEGEAPASNSAPLESTGSTDNSPPQEALSGCSLGPAPAGSWAAVGALAAVTGLAAARRRRHHPARRSAAT
jgi:hypothetical protein